MPEEFQNIQTPFLEEIKKNSGITIAVGVILLLMGFLVMGSPMFVAVSLTLVVGVMLIIGGIGQLVFAVKTDEAVAPLVVGILTLIAGCYLVVSPGAALSIFLSAYLVISGVFEVFLSFQNRPIQGWKWLLSGGIFSVLLGVLIWLQFPLAGAWAIGILIGIKLFLSGVVLLMFVYTARGAAKTLTGAD